MSRNLLTVRQFAQRHPAFCEGGLRWLIYNAEARTRVVDGEERLIPGNGLKNAIVRLGRRVLIDETEFFRQIEQVSRRSNSKSR